MLRAPFIHSFIVDEWDSTNPAPSVRRFYCAERSLRQDRRRSRTGFTKRRKLTVVKLSTLRVRLEGMVEIESQWTVFQRANQLTDGVLLLESERLSFPTQAADYAAWMGHTPSRENPG